MVVFAPLRHALRTPRPAGPAMRPAPRAPINVASRATTPNSESATIRIGKGVEHMTLKEAMAIIDKYEFKSVLTGDEEFLLLEALDFMIETTKDTQWMVRLGGYHYDKRNFDLALKYYEMADELGDKWAAEGLGYIWYYGRTGETDYEKAFKYYQKAMENGNLRSMVKVADMYKNGYGVEKNEDSYVELIEEAYGYVEGAQFLHEPLPEVCTRLAKIRVEQGKISEAVWLYFI